MSTTQKKAVITLFHKGKDLPRDELKSYRPISLLETDYKILAKVIACRLDSVIPDLIDEDQVGFMKGRKSSTVIRLIDDTIDFLNNENKPGILLALDYSRAFDSISKDFIIWSFKKFGFGENFIKWLRVIANNTESCLNCNGWLSEFFPVETGIRQGCPLSPMTFILALEILAIKIRSDNTIKGIKLPRCTSDVNEIITYLKLAMYADDITMFLTDHTDLENAIRTVNKFSEISLLKMNTTKTEAMWLGSMKHSRQTYCNLNWKKQVKILGIIFKSDTPASLIQENWQSKVNKIKQIILQWSKRNLSITGKLCIIKSFLISQVIYPLQSLSAPVNFLNALNTMLFRYLWKKNTSNTKAFEKVKRTVMCSEFSDGGIKMINIIDMQASFLLKWISELNKQGHEKWKYIPRFKLSHLGKNLLCLNATVNLNGLRGKNLIKSTFWENAINIWFENRHLFTKHIVEFKHQTLWNNKYVTYRQKHLFIRKWIDANINRIEDVFQNDTFIPLQSISDKTGNYPSLQFDYNAVRSAVMTLQTRLPNLQMTIQIPNKELTAKDFRVKITENKKVQPTATFFWHHRYNHTLDKHDWLMPRLATKEERLRLLQWKILHNIYPTNILLLKMGIRDNDLCDSCGVRDTIEHFFWKCTKLSRLWKVVEDIVFRKTSKLIKITEQIALFGLENSKLNIETIRIANHILLIAKMTISKFRYGEKLDPCCIIEREIDMRKI
jgi:hypothetical protein